MLQKNLLLGKKTILKIRIQKIILRNQSHKRKKFEKQEGIKKEQDYYKY